VYKLFEHALARVQKPDSPNKINKKRARARPRGQIQILRSYRRRLPQWCFLQPSTILAQAIFKAIIIRIGFRGGRTYYYNVTKMEGTKKERKKEKIGNLNSQNSSINNYRFVRGDTSCQSQSEFVGCVPQLYRNKGRKRLGRAVLFEAKNFLSVG
jgi:hypothetical protein